MASVAKECTPFKLTPIGRGQIRYVRRNKLKGREAYGHPLRDTSETINQKFRKLVVL